MQFLAKETRLTREIHELTVQVDGNKNNTTEIQYKLEEKQKELDGIWRKMHKILSDSPIQELTKRMCSSEDEVIYDSPNDILKGEANYFRQMFSFSSHPLNEDYVKELFSNNIKKWTINKKERKISAKAKSQRNNFLRPFLSVWKNPQGLMAFR
jgi:hypothetical protein